MANLNKIFSFCSDQCLLVTSKVYKLQVVKAKKGKGSFSRKNKHQGKEPY
ncbi:MAG: ribosome alternative rescue factor ArfA, partial [Alteromonadales bacterium]|nr:ribosome alternative rescue factor ArfA [Alteromonadales bacterium]